MKIYGLIVGAILLVICTILFLLGDRLAIFYGGTILAYFLIVRSKPEIEEEIEITEEPVPPASSLKICFAAFNYGSVGATLKNENTGALSGVEWNMSVNGGLLGRVDAYNNGTETIGAGNSTSICSGALQFGLGKVNIVAKAVAPGEDPIKAEATGFIIGKIVIIL